jgi:hypothetical protein
MAELDADEIVRRLAAAVRGTALYSSDHPLVHRGVEALTALSQSALARADSIVIGVIGDEVVVNGQRLLKSAASLVGFVRDLQEQEIEKVTVARGVTREEIHAFVLALADRRAAVPLAARLEQQGVRRITIGRLAIEQAADEPTGIAAARRVYGSAVETAETLWQQAKAGDKPDPHAAKKIIDSLAKLVSQDRTSLMALTAMKRYDNYTFTHMVKVSVLAMAQAR